MNYYEKAIYGEGIINYYEKAIRILGQCRGSVDVTDLMVEIASKNPKALVNAWDRLHPEVKKFELDESKPFYTARSLAAKGDKIRAIKALRDEINPTIGLRDAKNIVESWSNQNA